MVIIAVVACGVRLFVRTKTFPKFGFVAGNDEAPSVGWEEAEGKEFPGVVAVVVCGLIIFVWTKAFPKFGFVVGIGGAPNWLWGNC